jgi:hypothetical protein
MREREREREIALLNRMSLRPGLLWLTLDLALIIQCSSRNNIFFSTLHTRKMSSRNPGDTRTPDWRPLL